VLTGIHAWCVGRTPTPGLRTSLVTRCSDGFRFLGVRDVVRDRALGDAIPAGTTARLCCLRGGIARAIDPRLLMTKSDGAASPMSLLVGAATAVGVVGFMTVVGGILTWIPFKYANLPADQSVAVKPRTELLAVGIARLIPLLLLAAAVLIALFVIEVTVHAGSRKKPINDEPIRKHAKRLDLVVASGLIVLCLLLPLVFIPFKGEYAVTALIGIVGVAASYYILWRSGSFGWFAVSVLTAATLYAAALSLARTSEAPKLQAVAMLTAESETGVRGILVAETSDRIYLARIAVDCSTSGSAQGDPESARILIVPREEVVAMNVGPPQLVCNADRRSRQLLAELQALDLP
jgi:hypothetical protein